MESRVFPASDALYLRAEVDARRHREKIRQLIAQRLPELITEENFVLSGDRQKVRVPLPLVKEFRFRFSSQSEMLVVAGEEAGVPEVSVLSGTGIRGGAGGEPGCDYSEADISLEETLEIAMKELSLPRYQGKGRTAEARAEVWSDLRTYGPSGCLDRRRTLLRALRRRARQGEQGEFSLRAEDLCYRCLRTSTASEPRAVVLAMLDTSGSMGPLEKYLARSFFFWMVRFLETRYHNNVEIVYLAHHTEAKETTPTEFFRKGESGGTRCSSVYELALEIIARRYPPEECNIYAFHFSDGDNLPADNERCLELIGRLAELANLVGYGEIEGPYFYPHTLKSVYQGLRHPHLVVVTLRERRDVYHALKTFFART
ncbi:DUF444 family protein [Desulfothermobacter acidiphilus]|uniref:DUF444 family protein n=1 Tax=Desulfothermobacter acidiphilus TaxID=1938353 RepID=UPI003F88EDA9